MIREGEKNEQTALDNEAAIYGKREKVEFKDLKGAEKWQYFKDYILGKLAAGIVGLILLIALCITTFKPKPLVICSLAFIDMPLNDQVELDYSNKLSSILVQDEKKEKVNFDSGFYMYPNEVDSRIKISTYVASGDIDCMIMPFSEYTNYLDSDIFEDLETLLSPDLVAKYSDSYTFGKYYIDMTERLEAMDGRELPSRYVLCFIKNSKNIDKANINADALLRD